MQQKTSPVNWWRWVTATSKSIRAASGTGPRRGFHWNAEPISLSRASSAAYGNYVRAGEVCAADNHGSHVAHLVPLIAPASAEYQRSRSEMLL